MHDIECQRAIRSLLSEYSTYLTYGFSHQGQPRQIVQIALSPMTAPTGYYHIYVEVRAATSRPLSSISSGKTMRNVEYECTIHVVDAAMPQGLAVEPYEAMHSDFRELGNRIVSLLLASYHQSLATYADLFMGVLPCIIDPVTGMKFTVPRNSMEISKENDDQTWADPTTNTFVPLFYSRINFSLFGGVT